MNKIKRLLEKMRKHTSTYPNSLAIALVISNLIYIESIIFSVYVLEPRVPAEYYKDIDSLNKWIHLFVLFPIFMKLFNWKNPDIKEIYFLCGESIKYVFINIWMKSKQLINKE